MIFEVLILAHNLSLKLITAHGPHWLRFSLAIKKGEDMKTKRYSALKKSVPHQKQSTSYPSDQLTPSEIEQLQQEKKEDNAYFQKVFATNKPKNL